jgi:hypothetical protein
VSNHFQAKHSTAKHGALCVTRNSLQQATSIISVKTWPQSCSIPPRYQGKRMVNLMKKFQSTILFIDQTIGLLERGFQEITKHTERPHRSAAEKITRYEHTGKTRELACYLKLARIVSAMHAIRVLLPIGLFQECGVIMRTVVDYSDEIAFLSISPADAQTQIKKFLEDFFIEHPKETLGWKAIKREVLGKKKIHAALGRVHHLLGVGNAQQIQDAGYAISDVFSMFVHGSYTCITEMYDAPEKLQTNGSRDVYLHCMWADQMLVILPRALQALAHVAMMHPGASMTDAATKQLREFDAEAPSHFILP